MLDIKTKYECRYEKELLPFVPKLLEDLEEYLDGLDRIDRITVRAKSVDRFLLKSSKVEHGSLKYNDPLNQIQDQMGARVVCFYLDDVNVIADQVLKYYKPIETKTLIPDSVNEFGYFGKHFIINIPTEYKLSNGPNFFELQIKTLFQHAWSEASHDLAYKPSQELSSSQKRKVAFTSAQAWGADLIFNELSNELSA